MTDSTPAAVELAWDTFHQVVNMTAEELRIWLLNHHQDQLAVPGEPGPPLQELGLKVVQLLGKRKVDLTGEDADVMLRVADFVTQEEARRPDDAMNDEQWRHLLMTVGHDPLKSLGLSLSRVCRQPGGTMDHEETERVSTGVLPPDTDVQALINAGYERYLHLDEGTVADYIPALAAASPSAFGVCVAGVRGRIFSIGDADQEFAIESISKLFVFALVCHTLGHEQARRKLGVNSTGLPFNSVMAIELNADRTMNPLVNAGAIATTSLVPGTTADEKFESIVATMSRFAGRRLVMDDDVYESEAATNDRNRGIAHLLDGYGRMYCDPDLATDVYTRQCSVRVSARDLAVMGATLANGGVNPVTGEQAIETRYCKRVLAVLATAGLYEHSGQWLYDIGLPGKSGVAGGIVTVSPGKGGVGTFSPPLDAAGNSVRGQRITRYLSEALGLNLFASAPTG
jgi:glutaminase